MIRLRDGNLSQITMTQDMAFCMSVESTKERYIGK